MAVPVFAIMMNLINELKERRLSEEADVVRRKAKYAFDVQLTVA
jgi:hypothetical protein